ncbi:hypothetical protein SCUCBS95973_004723 [Sporothrix curviconia]|uniref:DUF7136 domain-containing protein n=1 Tax=Sporothrix curviconia TaxID=1260050 RepID=A0ABP0BRQ1_9PEZI
MAGLSLRRVLAPLLPVACLAVLAVASPEKAPIFGTVGRDTIGTRSLSPANSTDEASLLNIEIDVVFPRNETYAQTEILPIAISVQGLAPLMNSPDFKIIWDIGIYDPTPTASDVLHDHLDGGLFKVNNTLSASSTNDTDATVFVAYTNITSWIGQLNSTDHLVLSIGPSYNLTGLCDSRIYGGLVLDQAIFQIKSDAQLAALPDNATLSIDTALAQEPDCPEFAMIISAYPTSTTMIGYYESSQAQVYTSTTCSSYVGYDTDTTSAKPCAATVGPDARSAIGSMASSWATSASLSAALASSASAASASTKSTSTNAAAATALPLTPALAAVAAVYCIVY